MSLVLSRQREETIVIILEDGRVIEVAIVDIRGDKVRLSVAAAKTIKVHRKEVWDAIRKEELDGKAGKDGSQSDEGNDKAVDSNPPLDKEPQ